MALYAERDADTGEILVFASPEDLAKLIEVAEAAQVSENDTPAGSTIFTDKDGNVTEINTPVSGNVVLCVSYEVAT